MPVWLMIWVALIVGFFCGYVLCAMFRRMNEDTYPAPSLTVTHVTPQAMARMGEALSHAGDMMESGDFKYVSGGIVVQDLGHGVVTIRGDLSLRAVEHE